MRLQEQIAAAERAGNWREVNELNARLLTDVRARSNNNGNVRPAAETPPPTDGGLGETQIVDAQIVEATQTGEHAALAALNLRKLSAARRARDLAA
jgi:hypothetical protein